MASRRQSADRNTLRINVQGFSVVDGPLYSIPAIVYACRKGELRGHSVIYVDDFNVGFIAHVSTPGLFTLQPTEYPTSWMDVSFFAFDYQQNGNYLPPWKLR